MSSINWDRIISGLIVIGVLVLLGKMGMLDPSSKPFQDTLIEVIGNLDGRITELETGPATAEATGFLDIDNLNIQLGNTRRENEALQQRVGLTEAQLRETQRLLSLTRTQAQEDINQAILETETYYETEMACYPRDRVDAVDQRLFGVGRDGGAPGGGDDPG